MKKVAFFELLGIDDDAWHSGMQALLDSIKRFKVNPKHPGLKSLTSFGLSTLGCLPLNPDQVASGDAGIALLLGCAALPFGPQSQGT